MRSRYGQNFLRNDGALKKIAAALDIQKSDTVIEIGPGHGELTSKLLEYKPEKIICIEKDRDLIPALKGKFESAEIIEGDALEIIPELLKKETNIKLAGNIPYYITGFLFREIGDSENKPKLTVFTIQKEVAERIVSGPPEMNRLAAMVQAWSEPKILFSLPKEDFSPKPKVDSAVIALKSRASGEFPNLKNYFSLAKSLFQQPRKTIANNLLSAYKNISRQEMEKVLADSGLNPEMRPQNLRPENILELSSKLNLDK